MKKGLLCQLEDTYVRPSDICNDVCDTPYCEDEALCNGYHYGKYCMRFKQFFYIPPLLICDGIHHCDGGEDEEDCTVTSNTDISCRHYKTREIVPVYNYTRCGHVKVTDAFKLQVYCVHDEIASYQTNCSDLTRVAVTCKIDGYLSSVSKYLICFNDMISVCDDQIDSSCFSTKSCRVHKHLLCDGIMDCDDNADETNPICSSTTEGTCKRRVGTKIELPIPISWLRDGVWDCEDGIDETANWPKCGEGKTSRFMSSTESECKNVFICSSGSPGYELLENLCDGLENCGNENEICSISSRSHSLTTKVSTSNKGLSKTLSFCHEGLINRILILMIALGDFLIGCYLFIIATYDAIIFKQDYCKRQITWITSFECSVIGVLSTIGSQISLFSMTCLSNVRIYGIWNSMKIPGEVTLMKGLKIVAATSSIILVSATIAIVPIVESFEDFFVNGVRFSDGLKIFIGTPDKTTVTEIIRAYHGRTKDTSLRWKMLIEVVGGMFSHDFDYEDLTEKVDKVDFYGNDGVCLFKYFVKNKDPQKLFVWSILALNFLCFVFISISYLLIGILSWRSSRSLASSENNRQIAERNNRMNRRIAIIITTDFLCWVPFIVICILHSLDLIDATPWYSIFSMVILPINSVINPLLYDDVVTNSIGALVRALSTRITNSTILQRF